MVDPEPCKELSRRISAAISGWDRPLLAFIYQRALSTWLKCLWHDALGGLQHLALLPVPLTAPLCLAKNRFKEGFGVKHGAKDPGPLFFLGRIESHCFRPSFHPMHFVKLGSVVIAQFGYL